jgi:hypothetical protein
MLEQEEETNRGSQTASFKLSGALELCLQDCRYHPHLGRYPQSRRHCSRDKVPSVRRSGYRLLGVDTQRRSHAAVGSVLVCRIGRSPVSVLPGWYI